MKKLKLIKIGLILFLGVITLLKPHALFSPDTINQYSQAVSNIYNDWHPPIMAYSWRKLLQIINIKESIYYIYYICFVSGIYLISKYIQKKSYLMSLIFIISSFLIARLGDTIFCIWKDTGMLSAYLLAIGLILNIKYKKMTIIILLIILYGTSLRSNSIFAAFPLICLLFYKLGENNKSIILKSFVIWIGMLICINKINYNFLDARKLYPIKYIYISDIINISIRKDIEPPNFLKTKYYSYEKFKHKFINQPNINQYVTGENTTIEMIQNYNYNNYNNIEIKSNYEQIKKYWLNLILNNKILFLKIKIKFFLKLLDSFFIVIVYNFFLQIYLYFKKKLEIEISLIYASSIFYLSPYLIFNPSYDPRYIVYSLIIEVFLSIYLTYINFEMISENIKRIIKIDELLTDKLKNKI